MNQNGDSPNANAPIFESTSNDFIDMTTLGGRVKHTQLAAAAEIFRMVTSEKVKKAYERNKKQGKPSGRKENCVGRAESSSAPTEGGGVARNRQNRRRSATKPSEENYEQSTDEYGILYV